MAQTEKRILAVICTALLILAGCILTRFYLRMSQKPNDTAHLLSDGEMTAGFQYSTESTDLKKTQNGEDITSTKTFTHKIYTSEGSFLAKLTVTITGSVSPSVCAIDHLSATLSEEQWDGLTTIELTSEDTATVILFQDQLSVCHFQYRIFPDGMIDFL